MMRVVVEVEVVWVYRLQSYKSQNKSLWIKLKLEKRASHLHAFWFCFSKHQAKHPFLTATQTRLLIFAVPHLKENVNATKPTTSIKWKPLFIFSTHCLLAVAPYKFLLSVTIK
ncbi:hypothetical protein V8G54_036565 [Vigna mungo]|uniref:Uncharacterized protein n=1 Tax=Vigna mungo TaxID=3915 RepID=A0AAQ3MH03_VIGMU